MSDHAEIPNSSRELRSTVTDNGAVLLSVHTTTVPPPGDDEVVVRVEAAPINPSDVATMFAMGNPTEAIRVEVRGQPAALVRLGRNAITATAARVGLSLPVGNEGGGTVVAAGSSEAAQSLLGKVVGFLSGDAYAEYRTMPATACVAMHDGTTPRQAAAAFVNPLTALGMIETMHRGGHTALVHTVAASNLGLMLNRVCSADDIPLVNVVRRPEHIAKVRAAGGEYIVDSSSPTFVDDLADAIYDTRATIGFDAIGGGELASILLTAMERATGPSDGYSPYGSAAHKEIFIYGGLDRSPTILHRTFGFAWSVGGWLLTPFLLSLEPAQYSRLRRRVAAEITTTFASSYGQHISLEDAVEPDIIARYAELSTGDKALIVPHA